MVASVLRANGLLTPLQAVNTLNATVTIMILWALQVFTWRPPFGTKGIAQSNDCYGIHAEKRGKSQGCQIKNALNVKK